MTPMTSCASHTPPRLLVLTDIGGYPDDQQSMIRLMLYSNEIEIEGLIATASGTPGELPHAITQPHLIRQIVRAYGEVQPSLAQHDSRYPTPAALLSRIASGNPHRGWNAIGAGHDTDGSHAIIAAVDRDDPRPLHIAIWGGQTDLAQALWRVRHDRGDDGLACFIARFRVYDIHDQDGLAHGLQQQYPGLFYILSCAPPGHDKREAAYRGMYLGGDESLTSRAWIEEHVKYDHGPLGALYPMNTFTAPNPHGVLKEADTPSWLYIVPNGLSKAAYPEWGSWGGRFVPDAGTFFRDASDTVGGETSSRAAVWRWRPEFQNDFAARMDWCVKEYRAANHPPAVVIEPVPERVEPGARLVLDARRSHDPGGQPLMFNWWWYPEPGTYRGNVHISAAHEAVAELHVPSTAHAGSIHIILAVTNTGTPPLTRYARIVTTVVS